MNRKLAGVSLAVLLVLVSSTVHAADPGYSLAERTDVDSVNALAGLIIQVDQFGTSIAPAGRGKGGKNNGETGLSAGPVHIPGDLRGRAGSGGDRDHGIVRKVL